MGQQRGQQAQQQASKVEGQQREAATGKRREDPVEAVQELLGTRAASRQLRTEMQQGNSSQPLQQVVQSISPVSPRVQKKPLFRGVSQEWGGASSGLVVQAKLMIGEPDDQYEQEADRVAQQVVQQIQSPPVVQTGAGVEVQRLIGEDEEELQRKSESLLLGESAGGMAASGELEASIRQAKGGGVPLPETVREPMERAFGADFSGVRIHANAQADALNRSISAKAFTTGQDVFVRQGAYQPGSREGQELLAHELTHVVQQGGTEDAEESPVPTRHSGTARGTRAQRNQVGRGDTAINDLKGIMGYAPDGWIQRKKSIDDIQRLWPQMKAENRCKGKTVTQKKMEDMTAQDAEDVYNGAVEGAKRKFVGKQTERKDPIDVSGIKRTVWGATWLYEGYSFYAYKPHSASQTVTIRATRQKNIAGIDIETIQAAGIEPLVPGGAAFEYKTNWNPTEGELKSHEAFRNLDEERYGKDGCLNNSEILFRSKLLAEEATESLGLSKGTKPEKRITRSGVVNPETLVVMYCCDGTTVTDGNLVGGRTVERVGDGESGYANQELDFLALLGTPNGQSVGFIALQRANSSQKPVMAHITRIKYENRTITFWITEIW